LKKIATYLGINDKQSLMFAVTEENNVSLDKEENHLNSSNNSNPSEMMATNVKGTTGSGGGTGPGSSSATTTLAEDIYHRELEELDHIRSEYLTQLAQTREVESKMDDLQQQIDRTKLILRNSSTTDTHSVVDSGDLLLLNYMASRLYLLKELTSRDYDDFFTARAQYSSWCNDQQQLYLTLGKESLFHQQKYLKISKLIHNLAFEQSKRFLFQITQPSDSHSEHPLPPLLSTQLPTSSYAAASEEMKKVIHFKVRTKLSFDQLAEEGKLVMAQCSNHHLASHSASSPSPLTHPVAISAPLSARTHTSTSPRTGIVTTIGRERSQTTDSSLLFHHKDRDWDREEVKSSSQRSALSSPQITPRAGELPSPEATSAPPTPPSIENLGSLLSEFERELTTSLSEYEQNVCSTMESLSQMSLEAIRKKFVALNDTNGELLLSSHPLSRSALVFRPELPRYVADIQRRIEEKGTLVTTSSDYTEVWHVFYPPRTLSYALFQPTLLFSLSDLDRESHRRIRGENQNVIRVALGATDEPTQADTGEILGDR
jgi:hypothetical protein